MNALELVTRGELYGVIATFSRKYDSMEDEEKERTLFVSQQKSEIESALGRNAGDAVEYLREKGVLERAYTSDGSVLKMDADNPNLEVGREAVEISEERYSGEIGRMADEFDRRDEEEISDIIYSLEN